MRILLSAFACCPGKGSEPGLGWNWAVEAARQGHHVTVLTTPEHQPEIQDALSASSLGPRLRFIFYSRPWLLRFQKRGADAGYEGPTLHVAHPIWQFLLYRYVRRSLDLSQYDCIHHLTYSTIRYPTFLGRLPVPLILGPLGGGERSPRALRRGVSLKGHAQEILRDILTALLRFEPITRSAFRRAAAVYVKTRESRQALPPAFRHKATLQLEIGTRGALEGPRGRISPDGPLRVLYAGRFIYWKGIHLGLRALAEARRRNLPLRLTMVGTGPDEQAWRALADRLELADAIDWIPWVEHSKMRVLYCKHDLLLFPSLHDSSGNVVLESLANGLPVVCLDLGGPGLMVDDRCGRVIRTANRSATDCVADLRDALLEIGRDPRLLQKLRDGAHECADSQEMHWPSLVRRLYEDASRRTLLRAASTRPQLPGPS